MKCSHASGKGLQIVYVGFNLFFERDVCQGRECVNKHQFVCRLTPSNGGHMCPNWSGVARGVHQVRAYWERVFRGAEWVILNGTRLLFLKSFRAGSVVDAWVRVGIVAVLGWNSKKTERRQLLF